MLFASSLDPIDLLGSYSFSGCITSSIVALLIMSELPSGTLGDAVGVLMYTFKCLLADFRLIWLLWVHHDRLGCKLLPPNLKYRFF